MISAQFWREGNKLRSARISGHAGWAQAGQDVLCASVTSAVQLCANGITEVLGVAAEVSVADESAESRIAITLPGNAPGAAHQFLEALELHLGLLAQDYPDHIELRQIND